VRVANSECLLKTCRCARSLRAMATVTAVDNDDARIAEIERLFEAKGWRLTLKDLGDGVWEAAFWLTNVGATNATLMHGPSRLEAAEAAWAKYVREPWFGGT